jgi:hypothetical protein
MSTELVHIPGKKETLISGRNSPPVFKILNRSSFNQLGLSLFKHVCNLCLRPREEHASGYIPRPCTIIRICCMYAYMLTIKNFNQRKVRNDSTTSIFLCLDKKIPRTVLRMNWFIAIHNHASFLPPI